MRKRFRGNYPIAVSLELEGEGPRGDKGEGKGGGMLYAGRPAVGETVRRMGGGEDEGEGGEEDGEGER